METRTVFASNRILVFCQTGAAILSGMILLAILMTGLIPSSALAQRPDFTGTWALDKAASDSMDPVFQLQGISWAKRKLGANLDAKQEISQHEDNLVIVFDNLVGNVTQKLYFDGVPRASVNPAGHDATFTSSWSQDGKFLVATGPVKTHDGTTAITTERRSLSPDGRTLTLHVEVALPDGRKAAVNRVFRKQ